jgi:hypothetical protein
MPSSGFASYFNFIFLQIFAIFSYLAYLVIQHRTSTNHVGLLRLNQTTSFFTLFRVGTYHPFAMDSTSIADTVVMYNHMEMAEHN